MAGTNPDYPLHSISEISKRSYRLGVSSLSIGSVIMLFYCFLGIYQIAWMLMVFCAGIALILFLSNKKIILNTKLPIISFVSISLIVFAADEGFATGQYLFYFPLMIAIPIIVDNHKTQAKKVILYFLITALSCFACILVGRYHQSWEYVSAFNQTLIFCTNAIFAVFASMGFAYINISLERKYLNELIDQKNNTINTRTQFLSTMGHELRTPLNGIIGAINLLKKGSSLPEQQEYFDILKYCSDHMLHQVNDILDFNKIEAGKLEIHPVKVNLKQLLVNSTIPFTNVFEEKNVALRVEIDPKLDTVVMADDVRLIQVINNLLSNAGKFTSQGHILLSAKNIDSDENKLKVCFFVQDTGAGIEPKDQQKIFETFGQVFDEKTRKYTGSGLGLTICLQILQLMDSKLELKSAKGVGSTFSFVVEFEKINQEIDNELYAETEKADLEGTKILLVEDNRINMVIAKKILTDLKAQCTLAYNGEEALALLNENPDFNIVLMDLEMPVMDGYQAIAQIKQKWQHLPVLAFTATLMDVEMLESLKEAGFSDCLLKPFQALVLQAKIKKYALQPVM